MAAHYGISLVDAAHKNALNVVIALWQGEDPSQSENLSQPANLSGDMNDPALYWFGGRPYSDTELPIIQDIANNIPAASWPVQGVSGSVSQAQAAAAAAALILTVTTRDTYTSQQAQETLSASLGALGLKRAVWNY